MSDGSGVPDSADTPASDEPCTLGGGECGEGEKCVPVGTGDALVCSPAGTVLPGQPCGTQGWDHCVAGTACVPYDDNLSSCRTLCEANDGGCPQEFQVRIPYYGPEGATAGI